jgi:hypothetical protein
VGLTVLCGFAATLKALEVETGVEHGAHAKGIVVVRASFPSQGEVGGVGLRLTRDGVESCELGVDVYGRQNLLLRSIAHRERITTIRIPTILGRFQKGIWVFDEPGAYQLRWGVNFKEESVEGFKVHQAVELAPPLDADREFLERLADPSLLQRLFGEDFFDQQTESFLDRILAETGADHRALTVIVPLLKATRAPNPQEAARPRQSAENARTWAEAMYELAKELPDSSYAPYAAYYAGCCYSAVAIARIVETVQDERIPGERKDRIAEVKRRFALAKTDSELGKGLKAFAVAADHGDEYLKPRALYQQAFIQAFAGKLDDAEALLSEAEAVAPGEGTVREMIERVRQEICEFKQKLQQADDPNSAG